MGIWLSGCVSSGGPAKFQKGDARLAVNLPDVCDRFLVPVKAPVVTADSDARPAYSKTADALDKADWRLSTAKKCRTDERKAYAPPVARK